LARIGAVRAREPLEHFGTPAVAAFPLMAAEDRPAPDSASKEEVVGRLAGSNVFGRARTGQEIYAPDRGLQYVPEE
jgi:hypothetical protein